MYKNATIIVLLFMCLFCRFFPIVPGQRSKLNKTGDHHEIGRLVASHQSVLHFFTPLSPKGVERGGEGLEQGTQITREERAPSTLRRSVPVLVLHR